ncbi:MAG TPA: valine--tRNA ligase [Candidatus Paceibacterota bacterium]|nr:valine--tRNA ligase [Candidatus Paceibacterota bacterium]
MNDLPKAYNSKEVEDKTYELWEKSGFFNPENCVKAGVTKPDGEVFSIVLPPPNVTGTLHMGHAAMLAIQDILIRYHRMRGHRTLWLPGTDHAALATQSKVEAELYKKEKKTRHDLGREEFLARVEQFAKESHDTIIHQLRKMGSSLDWSREAYTLDEKRNVAVRTAFKKMYEEGLIYRGARIVNWDPKMQTTVSDDEVEYKEEKGNFYYLKYGPFTIGTARPETKFGDKYVVMHPDDARYQDYTHGQKIELEWINGPITATVIKDGAVDMEFGTGVMTITPWHDATDFDIAERHNLDKEQIIDANGKLLPIAGDFAGMHIAKARPAIVEKLKGKGLLEKIDENYTHRLATNSRGGGVIEPQIKEQWFIDVNKKIPGREVSLKELMRDTVESGKIKILPERFEKIYYHWIDNLRDWCISRQIWYGHRVPVWYKGEKMYVGVEPPEGQEWQQDPDTLDTWFSSGLWTFSTLGWPEETEDLKVYHPTSVLETGYDILFFWVARMILMTGYLLNDVPFRTVYLHGLVRDDQGRKMSKSLGNIIDPLDMIEKYGADATRLSLIIGAAPGNDVKLSEDRVRGYKHFANKVWNASKFVMQNTEDMDLSRQPELTPEDQQSLDELKALGQEITQDIENYRLYLAAEKLYHYFWHSFADVIIEQAKPVLRGEDEKAKASAQWTLHTVLATCLKLMHPFCPFVTEEVYRHLHTPDKQDTLMVEKWPA